MAGPPDWMQPDAEFERWCREGYQWEATVCQALVDAGVPAQVTEKAVRPSFSERGRYRDAGDIAVAGGATLGVKSKKIRFGPDPARYPDEIVLLGVPYQWQRADPKPVGFVIVSQLTGAMLVVPGYSDGHWRQKVVRQRNGSRQVSLYCPADCLIAFDRLVNYLRRAATAR
jgi:hypothetical protein